jgi:hypothetical protein
MKGVLYLLRFLQGNKNLVQKIHRYLILKERFHNIPIPLEADRCDIIIRGSVYHKTGRLHVNSIYITRINHNKSFVDIGFAIDDSGFKSWLLYWENIMHAYYEEKGIQKKRCNTIRNNTLFCRFNEFCFCIDSDLNATNLGDGEKRKAKRWGRFRVGTCVKDCHLYIHGIHWEHEEAKMRFQLV